VQNESTSANQEEGNIPENEQTKNNETTTVSENN
jgi:hypothetical protein